MPWAEGVSRGRRLSQAIEAAAKALEEVANAIEGSQGRATRLLDFKVSFTICLESRV